MNTCIIYLSISIRQQTKIVESIIPNSHIFSLQTIQSSRFANKQQISFCVLSPFIFFIFLLEEIEVSCKVVRGKGGIKSLDNPHTG